MLGIETLITTYHTVYNGMTDDDTRIDNLHPTFVFARVNLLEVTVDGCWNVVVSLRACFRVLPRASACFLVHASCWSRDQDGSLTAHRHFQSRWWNASVTSGLTEAGRSVACATVNHDTLLLTLHPDHEGTLRSPKVVLSYPFITQ